MVLAIYTGSNGIVLKVIAEIREHSDIATTAEQETHKQTGYKQALVSQSQVGGNNPWKLNQVLASKLWLMITLRVPCPIRHLCHAIGMFPHLSS